MSMNPTIVKQSMEPSTSAWRTTGSRMLSQVLLLALLQLVLLSSARNCSGSRDIATAALDSEDSPISWLTGGPAGDDSDEREQKFPSRRALFQTVDGNVTEPSNQTTGPDLEDEDLEKEATPISEQKQLTTTSKVTVYTVNQVGTGDFGTVQEAVDAVPVHNTQRVLIRIQSGIYRSTWEKVYIPSNRPFITFLGRGVVPPVISWNDSAASVGSTWKSATVAIDASHFIAQRITFENTAPAPPPGAVGGQAIALRIGGDMAAFYACNFLGAQDTLCDWMGRHYFHNCFIQGSIDFIFGDGQSFYEGCLIHSIATTSGCITAQSRQNYESASGFSFVNCTITGTGSISLGRAWGPYSRVVFSLTTMANVINPVGWDDWGSPSVDEFVYYGEFNNVGQGADLKDRVWFAQALTLAQASPFLTIAWVDGEDWLD